MRHAKEYAAKVANEMLEKKLMEARFAYEEELEHIAKQFEDMQEEVRKLNDDKLELKRQITMLEGVISEQNNMMETTGYYQG